MPMRRPRNILPLVLLLAMAPAFAGCANFDLDKLDVFGWNEKKKLPGERQPVFPEGVPGVTQGIPPEYIKGHQPPEDSAQLIPPEPAASAPPPAPEKPKPKAAVKRTPKPAAKPKPVAAAPQAEPAAQQQQPAAWPAPQQQDAGTSSNTAPWPAAPTPGGFSR